LSAYYFEEPLRTLLHQFKYQGALFLRSLFVELMLDAVMKSYQTECLIPMPIHPLRLRERGFNQAMELAKYLGKHLGVPIDSHNCSKIINTSPQVSLDVRARRKNVSNSFEIEEIKYQHVTIIDDLLTTGSSANALASQLKTAGVKHVDVWCLARTSS